MLELVRVAVDVVAPVEPAGAARFAVGLFLVVDAGEPAADVAVKGRMAALFFSRRDAGVITLGFCRTTRIQECLAF